MRGDMCRAVRNAPCATKNQNLLHLHRGPTANRQPRLNLNLTTLSPFRGREHSRTTPRSLLRGDVDHPARGVGHGERFVVEVVVLWTAEEEDVLRGQRVHGTERQSVGYDPDWSASEGG
jgi:hypothetical protein